MSRIFQGSNTFRRGFACDNANLLWFIISWMDAPKSVSFTAGLVTDRQVSFCSRCCRHNGTTDTDRYRLTTLRTKRSYKRWNRTSPADIPHHNTASTHLMSGRTDSREVGLRVKSADPMGRRTSPIELLWATFQIRFYNSYRSINYSTELLSLESIVGSSFYY